MKKDEKQQAVFGYGLATILTVWAIVAWRKEYYLWSSAVLILAITAVIITRSHPKLLKLIYERWMKVAHAIGYVLTSIVLMTIFYFVFTPVGLILRVLRKDLLDRGWASSEKSYWKKKEVMTDKVRYLKQF